MTDGVVSLLANLCPWRLQTSVASREANDTRENGTNILFAIQTCLINVYACNSISKDKKKHGGANKWQESLNMASLVSVR